MAPNPNPNPNPDPNQVLHGLEEVMLCGAGQSVETLVGWRLSNNVPIAEFYGKGAPRVNYLADLSRDRSLPVRRRFMQCLARWLFELPGEDIYEQEVRLMPYLVSCLFDEDAVLQQEAYAQINALGEAHLRINEADYKEKVEYGYLEERRKDEDLWIPPPAPFNGRRPVFGARERVRQHFRALIYPIVAELESWTSKERYQSAKLLHMLLIFTETHVTEFAHQVLPAVAKASDPENPELASLVATASAVFSQWCEPQHYMPVALSKLRVDALNPLSQRVQYINLMPALIRGMRPPTLAAALPEMLADIFAHANLTSQHTPMRGAVASLLRLLVELTCTHAVLKTLAPQVRI